MANDALWSARACRQPVQLDAPPGQWRVGGATWRRFAETLDLVATTVPHGERIAIRTPPERWMLGWYAAYLLPHHPVLPLSHDPRPGSAPYAVSLDEPWNDPALTPIEAAPGVWIYRRPPFAHDTRDTVPPRP